MGGRPHSGNQAQLRAVDQQLRAVSVASITPSPSGCCFPFLQPRIGLSFPLSYPLPPLPMTTVLTIPRLLPSGASADSLATGARQHHRRSHLRGTASLRHQHGPLDGRRPEPACGATLGADPEVLDNTRQKKHADMTTRLARRVRRQSSLSRFMPSKTPLPSP